MDSKMFEQYVSTDKKYLYSPGEKVYVIYKKTKGTIRYLRNDSYEIVSRDLNPFHYYYYVDFDDGSFDTYVSFQDLIPLSEVDLLKSISNLNISNESISNPNLNTNLHETGQQFFPGQKFRCIYNGKTGTIKYLRDDSHEKKSRALNPSHYYYHVDFDDGSFETYIYGKNMVHI